jgi:hypothetical protein
LIRALFQLAEQEHLLLDADHGNFALKSRYGDDLMTKTVGWHVGPATAPAIVSAAKGLPVLMDAGASMLASQREIVDLLPALRDEFVENGYRTVALMPISPNKIGAARALKEFATKLGDFEKMVVKNNRDGSGQFEELPKDYPLICIPHLSPGLNAYLFCSRRDIADVVTNPEQGYITASAHIGHWVRTFASDPHVQNLLGRELCESAIRRLPPAPTGLRPAFNTYNQVNDENFEKLEHMLSVADLISRFEWTACGLRQAADVLDAQARSL